MTVRITDAARAAVVGSFMGLIGPSGVVLHAVYRRPILTGRGAPDGCALLPDEPEDADVAMILGQPPHERLVGPASAPLAVIVKGTSLAFGEARIPSCPAGDDARIYALRACTTDGRWLWDTRDLPGVIGAAGDNSVIDLHDGVLTIF